MRILTSAGEQGSKGARERGSTSAESARMVRGRVESAPAGNGLNVNAIGGMNAGGIGPISLAEAS